MILIYFELCRYVALRRSMVDLTNTGLNLEGCRREPGAGLKVVSYLLLKDNCSFPCLTTVPDYF